MSNKFLFYISIFSAVITAGLFSTGCNDVATTPSFIRIDTIIVDSSNYNYTGPIASKVNFAWVYIDDNLQGVYQLPCKFPVIGDGAHKITVFAGVYEFGNGTSATRYIFYNPWTTNDTLVVEDTLGLKPHVKYLDSVAVFPYKFDFDDAVPGDFVYLSGSGVYTNTHSGGYSGNCLGMFMGPSDTTTFSVETATAQYVPKGGAYFVELNYKCNSPFFFDVKTSSATRPIIGFNTKNEWNKAYINITYAMDVTPGTDVKLVFRMSRDPNIPNQEVLIDNIKLIYLP